MVLLACQILNSNIDDVAACDSKNAAMEGSRENSQVDDGLGPRCVLYGCWQLGLGL